MTYTVSITSQGQMSIPAPLRRKYNFTAAQKATVVDNGEGLFIKPIKDASYFMGIFKTNKRLTRKQEREAFEAALARGEA